VRSAFAQPLERLEDAVHICWADGRAGVGYDHLVDLFTNGESALVARQEEQGADRSPGRAHPRRQPRTVRLVHYPTLPVSLGIFDDANGLVQISGPGISAGEIITLFHY
jgi:hypothetical protein